MQADIVLERKLRVLHLDLKAAERTCFTQAANRRVSSILGGALGIGDLKDCLYSDIIPPVGPRVAGKGLEVPRH